MGKNVTTRSIRLENGKMKIKDLKITEQSIKEFWDEREAKYSMTEADYNYLIASLQAELITLNSKIIRLQDALVNNKQISSVQRGILSEQQLPAMKEYAQALSLRIEDLQQRKNNLA